MRKKTRQVTVGNVKVGGNAPISVQSMTTTDTKDAKATIKQILDLEEVGCEIIRVSAPDIPSAQALKEIKENINIPLVADIHFDYRCALEAAKYADKIRINPGNIGSEDKVKQVVNACKERSLPIRIGVNLGSLERDLEKQYGYKAEAMLLSAERHIKILEKLNFEDIIVSLKASDAPRMVKAYQLFSEKYDYPVHLGVTEAGSMLKGSIKSAIGMGILLNQGIGDTIRVSLSSDPIEEVKTGWQILKNLGLRTKGVDVASCPTCARTNVDVIKLVEKIEETTEKIKEPISLAIMGCAVNGPGESKKTDIGIVGGPNNKHILYRNGEIAKWIAEEDIEKEVLEEVDKIVKERSN